MAVIGSPVDSTWVNPSSVALTGSELRRADSAMFAGAGVALGVAGGVVRHGDTSLQVTVNGSDTITVQAGAAVIPGNATGVGCYRTALAASVSGGLAARDATNARIDLVVFHQLDTDVVVASGGYQAQIETVTGTPSATPGAPALPSQAIELARITVPATGGGSSTVDSSFRTYAAAIGGEILASTASRLPTAAAKYQTGRALDTGVGYLWDGTAWQPRLAQVAAGTTSFGAVAKGATLTKDITFPAGRFTTAPRVFLNSGRTRLNLSAVSVTATGFTITADNYTTSDASATTVDYFATASI